MAREFKETAHLNTNKKKYESSYDRIFNKKKKLDAVSTVIKPKTEEKPETEEKSADTEQEKIKKD